MSLHSDHEDNAQEYERRWADELGEAYYKICELRPSVLLDIDKELFFMPRTTGIMIHAPALVESGI